MRTTAIGRQPPVTRTSPSGRTAHTTHQAIKWWFRMRIAGGFLMLNDGGCPMLNGGGFDANIQIHRKINDLRPFLGIFTRIPGAPDRTS